MSFLATHHDPHRGLRAAVIETALGMNRAGINQGKSGNVSVRINGGFLITPTGIPYDKTEPDQVVSMRMDGTYDGAVLPSSEWRFHRDIYAARENVSAIVHTHSIHATALAVNGCDIPAFHYMVAIAGGDSIRCAPYATFGTQELSDCAVAALRDRKACLLAHHGVIALGTSLEQALAIAIEIEALAAMYVRARSLGDVPLLSADEMARVVGKFETYGQQKQTRT